MRAFLARAVARAISTWHVVRVWIGASRRRQVAVLSGAAVLFLFMAGTGYGYESFDPVAYVAAAPANPDEELPTEARLESRQRQLRARLAQAAPRGRYIVVDQTNNRLYLREDDEVLLEAVCSAGSGFVLREQGGKEREWTFDTPRGKFQVLTRIKDPIWRKPDWAFVEEGQPIPKNVADRLEPGTLGEYALYFGNGFMIHGTLYERLLGRSVTHGCIRLGRDDLRVLWSKVPVGTPIYIF